MQPAGMVLNMPFLSVICLQRHVNSLSQHDTLQSCSDKISRQDTSAAYRFQPALCSQSSARAPDQRIRTLDALTRPSLLSLSILLFSESKISRLDNKT